MNIEEIIAQEENAFKAEMNVRLEIKKNKAEILLPFAMHIFDFLEVIQNDPNFLFTSTAHASGKDWTPLFSLNVCTFAYHKKSTKEDIEEKAYANVLLRSFAYGNGNSRYLHFRVGDDFKPYVAFSREIVPLEEDKIFTTEEAIRTLTKFFLKMRKPL